MKLRFVIPVLIGLVFPSFCQAQYKSAPVWVFGENAGIDFNSGTPTAISRSIYSHSASSSSQCDASGNLMFYANGIRIWDKNGAEMPGSINPAWTNYESGYAIRTIIVPDFTDLNKYFVFCIFPSPGNPPYGAYYDGQLTYSVVDMSLRGGLGDVIPGKNHLLLDSDVGNYMQVVPDDQCNLWLVVHSGLVHTFRFRSYRITASGINTTPVISTFPFLASAIPAFPYGVDNRNGNMVYSYTRDKFFVAYNAGDLYAFDFDKASGSISNAQLLGWNYAPSATVSATLPGICLSPSEQFLYTCGYTYGNQFEVRQYPVQVTGSTTSLGSPDIVFATSSPAYLGIQQSLPFNYWESNLQQGPDHKIYMVYTLGQGFLACIKDPDQPGSACNFDPMSVTLLSNTYTTSALPYPAIDRPAPGSIDGVVKDTAVCFADSIVLKGPDGFLNYIWQNGYSGQSLRVYQSGTYYVRASNSSCQSRVDTFHVTLTDFHISLGNDTTICINTSLPLNVAVPGASYSWQDGSTGAAYLVNKAGVYYVEVIKNGCIQSDTIRIQEEICDCVVSIPTVFSPNNDGHNDLFRPLVSPGCPVKLYNLHVYNRWGALVFTSDKITDGWDGTYQGEPADVGTYMYYVEFKGGRAEKQLLKGDITLVR